jgi:hypothetical protein
MIFVRPTRPEDAEKFSEWAKNTPNLDTSVFRLPETYTLCAYDDTGVLGFIPVQTPAIASTQMLESVVFRPGISDMVITGVMRELVHSVILVSYMKNAGELYFIGDHPETNKIAEKIFEKVEYPVYRLRLKDLEG